MATNDIYRLSVKSTRTVSGDEAVNIFHFKQLTPEIFDTVEEDLVECFEGEVVDYYKSCFTPAYVITLFDVRQVTGGDGVYEKAVSIGGAFGSAANQLATQVSCLISWRSGLAGRSRRGRSYLPAADEGAIADGLFTPAYKVFVQDFIDHLLGMADHGSAFYGLYQFVVWSGVLAAAVPVTTGLIRSVPSSIQKRKIGRGS